MKKTLKISATVLIILTLTIGFASLVQAQTQQNDKLQGTKVPMEVMKILEKTCVNCHSEPGKTLALSHVNLSKWDQYSPDKQADKAKSMCKEVTKEKMPPKKFRDEHPESIPTSDEIKTICDWAQSLEVVKK